MYPADVFTGIVEAVGTVVEVSGSDDGRRVMIQAALVTSDMHVGASIAVNGTCLTVVDIDRDRFALEMVPETLGRTNLGAVEVGGLVNLERAMPASGRFDGHIVQGHVDGIGRVGAIVADGDGVRMTIVVPPELGRYVVEKGSITFDGVSLTVAGVSAEEVSVALIPHTLAMTTLGSRRIGDAVNVEVDVLAKYVERLQER